MLQFHNTLTGKPADRHPNLDVHEENGDIVVKAEVPGLELGEIQVSCDHGDLVFEGDGWDGHEAGHEHYEHLYSRLPLPFEADASRIVSRVEEESVEVRIPVPAIAVTEEWLVPEEIAY
jgi:HSP20 family molecular chaperone IbpA